jgi:two-component system, NarL family, sensor histidine kinase EvgS
MSKWGGTSPLGHIGYWAAAIVIVGMGWALSVTVARMSESAHLVAHALEVVRTIGEVNEALGRAESAQRGFLLSENATFLVERDEALAAGRARIQRIRDLTSDNPAQQERIDQVDKLFAERVVIMGESAQRRREEGLAATAARIGTGIARQTTTRLYALTEDLKQDEVRLLEQRRLDEARLNDHAALILAAALVLVLGAMVPGYIGFIRQARSRYLAERRLLDLAETLPGAVVQYRTYPDGRSKYEFLSPNVEKMRGIDRQAALADPEVVLGTILEPDRQPFLNALARGAKMLTPIEHDYRVRGPDGSIRWMRTTAAPRKAPDGSVLWSAFWADVTDKKAMVGALREAKDEAEAATRAKSTFLATMSHEIRTPMNGVLGMLELLSLTRLDAEQRTTLEVIRESGRSLLRIIDDILDFSKVEAGKLDLRPEPALIADVVARTCDVYRGSASSKGLLIKRTVDERMSAALVVDPLRLQQILNNFVSNAIKFTQRGSIQVSAELLERRDGKEKVRFTVQDSGVGISEEDREKLFAPFAQAQATAGQYGGTGLGLAICRRLAEMMGGAIAMQSEVGVGTTMTLTLTLPIGDAEGLLPATAPQPSTESRANPRRALLTSEEAAREGTLVLVADDHPINRMVLLRQVNAIGYTAEVAEDGVAALRLWESGRFSLVLSDCNMPELDGYQLAQRIREAESREGRRRTPIIACTANALGGEAEKCFAAGMDDYLSKPVQLTQLATKLWRWLPLPDAESDAIFDPNVMAEISEGDAQIEREILLRFHRENSRDAEALDNAVQANAIDAVTRFSHRIVGAARTVGAKRLALACERMERAARDKDWEAIASHMPLIHDELARLDAHVGSLSLDRARP